MLEVKDLRKDYKPKKSAPVHALDGVSIKFPEKGMVFILGKSGSGKSTLLNLLGGLDQPTSGEIVIKGKSSKDFKQSEFDSYRNTYLGFIFQEYNILNDFNVAQNIGIALQLQGRKATSEEINSILEEVDLEGYGGRKPSELSGGQKQRVAIARALVKNPEIIMADEPTGALDSKTGLQVFDTLKKLSEKKLVIVITHDRDFAEMYGDRVIELKDGKVVSDIEKYSAEARRVSSGVSITDDTIISVKKGYVLTAADVDLINGYLQKNDVMISVDEKSNKDLKRFARINENGDKDGFKDTDESKIKYSEDSKFRLIKSRLPLKNTIKIGASSLKNKPFRLVLTILLSLVAFTMFGLTDTFAAYNKVSATERSIETSGTNVAAFTVWRYEETGEEGYSYRQTISTRFSDDDVKALSDAVGSSFKPVVGADISLYAYGIGNKNGALYQNGFTGYIEADAAYLRKLGFTVEGTLPARYDEVAISAFYYEFFKTNGYVNGDLKLEADEIVSERSFLDRHPTILNGDGTYTITAIVDTNFPKEKYESLTTEDEGFSITDYILYGEYEEDVKYGYHGLLFVKEGFFEQYLRDRQPYFSYQYYDEYAYMTANAYMTRTEAAAYPVVYVREESDRAENGILIDLYSALSAINADKKQYGEYEDAEGDALVSRYDAYRTYYDSVRQYGEEGAAEYGATAPTEADVAEFIQSATNYILGNKNLLHRITNCSINIDYTGWMDETTVDGVLIDDSFSVVNAVVIDDATQERIRDMTKGKYDCVLYGNPSKEDWQKIVRFHYGQTEDGVEYSLRNGVMSTISSLNDIVETLSNVFLYIGIGFAVFAALMLTNFISTSIVYKKREIGILRAVGARGSDVYGIFAVESIIIALINFALSVIATGVICGVVGMKFRQEYHLSISILNFGIRQIALILGVAVVVALIASFLPTFRISRQKPVDAIKK